MIEGLDCLLDRLGLLRREEHAPHGPASEMAGANPVTSRQARFMVTTFPCASNISTSDFTVSSTAPASAHGDGAGRHRGARGRRRRRAAPGHPGEFHFLGGKTPQRTPIGAPAPEGPAGTLERDDQGGRHAEALEQRIAETFLGSQIRGEHRLRRGERVEHHGSPATDVAKFYG